MLPLKESFDALAGDEGGFEDLSAVSGELDLVEGKTGVGELGTDLGGEGTTTAAGGLESYGDWSGILLGLEGDFVGVVLGQNVCVIILYM